MRINNAVSAGIAAGAMLLLGACQGGGGKAGMREIASQTAGDVNITLLNEAGELDQGQNQFRILFQTVRDNQPWDAGHPTVSSSMAMPGMAPMVAPIELTPAGEPGQYSLTGSFAMSGAWKFEVRWSSPSGPVSTSFSVNVR